MSSGKKDFYGKEVTDAIAEACKRLRVPQEELEIEVVETGSTGIFGLIRKKAHIRAGLKDLSAETAVTVEDLDEESIPSFAPEAMEEVDSQPLMQGEEDDLDDEEDEDEEEDSGQEQDTSRPRERSPQKQLEEIRPESVELVRSELGQLLSLMGFPSEVTAELDGPTVRCHVSGEHEETLTGQEGKTIDSVQYLLRKLIARKVVEKVRISIDVGEFREKRKTELVERAKELAALVKEDGKTQAIPPLNPSERRIVHVALQDDKEIRSRSVGDGLFKKILIYKPGKGKKSGGGRRPSPRGKRGRGGNKPQENDES